MEQPNRILKYSVFIFFVLLIISAVGYIGLSAYKTKQMKDHMIQTQQQIIEEQKAKIKDLNTSQLVTPASYDGNRSDELVLIRSTDLENYVMNHYNYLSNNVKREMITYVFDAARKYKINPIVLLAVLETESGMRYWIKHSTVYVTAYTGKKVKTNAIGMGGIIWEVWKPDLIKNGIARTKADLYLPKVNIEATAFVLSKYIYQCRSLGSLSQLESGIQRYYGVVYHNKKLSLKYLQKIKTTISNILLESMAKDICERREDNTTKRLQGAQHSGGKKAR